MKTAIVERRPEIKYPQKNEIVISPMYSVCVAAPFGARTLEISIDRGPWLNGRKEAGYWWYDWSDYANGEHEIVARARGSNGRLLMSPPRAALVHVLMKRRGQPRRGEGSWTYASSSSA